MSKQAVERMPEARVPAMAESASIMQVISRLASDPNSDVAKLKGFMDLYERAAARQSEQAFNDAMRQAQAEMRPVAADSSNPQTKSKYASYLVLDRAIRPIYTRHGFALSFNTTEGAPAEHVRVVCMVSHTAGHTRVYQTDMPADGKGAKGGDVMTRTHAVGSAMTYGSRYLLKMIFNMTVGDDDDGNAAGSGEKINQAQLERLSKLADEVGADKAKYCKYMKIESLAALPVEHFDRAIAALEGKRKKA